MKNEINTQRQSSSTAEESPEINPKASPPLDEASCSASSFWNYHFTCHNHRGHRSFLIDYVLISIPFVVLAGMLIWNLIFH